MSVRHSGGVSANPDGPETRPTEATSADAEPVVGTVQRTGGKVG